MYRSFMMTRCVVAWWLLGVSMMGAQLKVDHVTVAGRSLATLQRMFDSVGLKTEYGGKHTNGMTEMALMSFSDGSYVELIAAQRGASAAGHEWGDFIEHQAGPCAWAIAVPDIDKEAQRMKSLGITLALERNGRQRPDGTDVEWVMAGVGPPPRGSFFPFLIQDITPHEKRAFPRGEPTNTDYTGVAMVVVGVKDLANAIAQYRRVFGLGEPRQETDPKLGARLAYFPNTPVVLASPSDANSWLAQRLHKFGEIPCGFVLRSKTGQTGAFRSKWFDQIMILENPESLGEMWIGIVPQAR